MGREEAEVALQRVAQMGLKVSLLLTRISGHYSLRTRSTASLAPRVRDPGSTQIDSETT